MRWTVPLTLAAPRVDAVVTHTTGMLAPMPGAVRRPTRAVRVLVAGLVVLTASGCGGIGQPAAYDSRGINGLVIPTPTPDPDDFVSSIDNPWLPLTPGSTWGYDVTDDDRYVGALDRQVLEETTQVAGLSATVVRTTTRVDGAQETSTRFYAQDDDGNVWWLGEDSADAAWRAGEDGAQAGLAMPAFPRLGDGWRPYAVDALPEASVRVEQQGRDMVQTLTRVGEADASTRETYTSGVGPVSVEELDSGRMAVLVDHQPG